MAAVTTARSICRSIPVRNAAAKVAAGSRSTGSRPPLSALPRRSPRFLRSPVELSSCVESLLPMHSVTASALMTSMLSFSPRGYVWLSEGKDDM